MSTRHLLAIPVLLALVAGCASAASTASPPAPTPAATAGSTGSTAAPSGSPDGAAPSAATRIEVALTDALRIEPATMTVPAGVPVTFVVSNMGATEHEFYVGDEAAQAQHAEEMMGMGGMAHDEPMGIGVAPGETKELTITFPEPAALLAGCHVAGHYQAGMMAGITVTD